MFSEHLKKFHGQSVIEFEDDDSWKGPEYAYRIREDYEESVLLERLNLLLDKPNIEQLSCLIIGAWNDPSGEEGTNTAGAKAVVAKLVEIAPKLPGLRHLFFGEMTGEDCEISWINQCDMSPILKAFPNLESLRVRGGNSLSFSKVRSEKLKEIAVETGGLGRDTIRELFLCDFPALEHLELLLGEDHYGFDGGVGDLQPVLSGKLFPNLKFLGLMNSEIANEIAAVIVNSPIVERLESIDLSMGNLDNEGVQSLLGLAAYKNLKLLNISHHYATEETIATLKKALPFEVVAEDMQEPDDEWRPILHAE